VWFVGAVVCETAARAETAAAERPQEFASAIEQITQQRAAHRATARPPKVAAAHELLMARTSLRLRIKSAKTTLRDWSEMAARQGMPERSVIPEVVAALDDAESALESPLADDVDVSSSGSKAETVDAPPDSVVETSDMLLQALCVAAAADSNLSRVEIDMIVSAVTKAGCPLPEDVLHSRVVDLCKEIHQHGVADYAQRLCQQWQKLKGTAFVRLALRLQVSATYVL
jgi:hypothetical protein